MLSLQNGAVSFQKAQVWLLFLGMWRPTSKGSVLHLFIKCLKAMYDPLFLLSFKKNLGVTLVFGSIRGLRF